jgi:hypothetical protein
MKTDSTTSRYLKDVENLLIRNGVPVKKLRLNASLQADLKLHPNDYYFLTLDLEALLEKPVDLDKVYESKTVSDLIVLMATDENQ